MTIADRIKILRMYQNMTQEELAKKMGYSSKSAVSRTENAGDNLGQKRIREFAKALGVSESYLMGWTELDDAPVPKFEMEHQRVIALYSQLTPEEQKIILNTMSAFVSNHTN